MLKEVMVLKLFPDAKLPSRKHNTDAGLDLYYYDNLGLNTSALISGFDYMILETGIAIEIPEGFVGQVWPKSKSNFLVGGGVIDAGYQGEILVKVINPTDKDILIKNGEAIAQLLILPVETPTIREVDSEKFHKIKSDRGATGGILTQTSKVELLEDGWEKKFYDDLELPEASKPDINEGLHW